MREALTKLRDEEMSHLSVWGYGNVEERESHFSWGEFGRFLKSGSQLRLTDREGFVIAILLTVFCLSYSSSVHLFLSSWIPLCVIVVAF